MSRKVTLVKKNLAPSAKPLGVNPMDPWSTKANISEASEKELLHRFLKAKGINPMFVSTDTKIAHSKSGEFIKWRRDHDFQEQIEPEILKQMIDEGVFTDDESIAKHLVKKYGKNVDAHQIRLAHHFHPEKHKTTPERIAGHVNRLLGKTVTEESIDEGLYVDHEEIAKHLVNRKGVNVNANDIHHASILHKDAHKVSTDLVRRHVLHLLGKGPNPQHEGTSALDRFRQAAAEREKKHNEIEKQMKARHAAGKEDMKGSIDRLEKHLNKEEVVAEKNDSHTHAAHYEDPKTGEWTGMNLLIAKNDEDAIRQANEKCKEGCRLTKVERHITVKEDVYQDSQAATQTAFDMGTTPNQTEPTSSRRREMSKSARIIKSLYKKHKMVKEEMYDHEKEDKSVQTYGKKPKMDATNKKDSFGENKPEAAAIMSGGTTLTGGKRDDVEIDPMMRNKPGQNVFNKDFGKKGS
jgi:hypothetical protein